MKFSSESLDDALECLEIEGATKLAIQKYRDLLWAYNLPVNKSQPKTSNIVIFNDY